MKWNFFTTGFIVLLIATGCKDGKVDADKNIGYCVQQAAKTLAAIPADSIHLPRNVAAGKNTWGFVGYKDWTSGFWPGILRYAYEYTKDDKWKTAAARFSSELAPLS